jgi:hypothetical protein
MNDSGELSQKDAIAALRRRLGKLGLADPFEIITVLLFQEGRSSLVGNFDPAPPARPPAPVAWLLFRRCLDHRLKKYRNEFDSFTQAGGGALWLKAADKRRPLDLFVAAAGK